jgi:hypothetical protein
MTKQGPVVIKDGARGFRFEAKPDGKKVKITVIQAPNTRLSIIASPQYEEAIIDQLRSAFASARAVADYDRSKPHQ